MVHELEGRAGTLKLQHSIERLIVNVWDSAALLDQFEDEVRIPEVQIVFYADYSWDAFKESLKNIRTQKLLMTANHQGMTRAKASLPSFLYPIPEMDILGHRFLTDPGYMLNGIHYLGDTGATTTNNLYLNKFRPGLREVIIDCEHSWKPQLWDYHPRVLRLMDLDCPISAALKFIGTRISLKELFITGDTLFQYGKLIKRTYSNIRVNINGFDFQ